METIAWFGASKMTPSEPRVAQLQHKTVFKSKCELVCCTASLGLVRVQPQRRHLKGSMYHCCGYLGDMWRSRVLFWKALLPNAGQLTGFCVQVTVVSLMISMVNIYPRPRHTREGDRNLNPCRIVLGLIFRLQIQLALRLQATPALYRSNAGFPPI